MEYCPDKKPEREADLQTEAYHLRLELWYFKQHFNEFVGKSGCIHVKLNKLWIYFLSLSNAGIYLFILYYVFFGKT